MSRSPFVYWAQTEESISLRVDVRGAEGVICEAKKTDFTFSATARQEQQPYEFSLKLHASVLAKPLDVRVLENRVEVTLKKQKRDVGFWPTLLDTGSQQKPQWLKFDFDKWKDPDGEEDEQPAVGNNPYDDLIRQFSSSNTPVMGVEEAVEKMKKLFNGYLALYNFCIFFAHFYVLLLLIFGLTTRGSGYLRHFWRERYASLMTCTLMLYMDVLHAWMGITKSGWKTAAVQITGRITVLWIIDGNPSVHAWWPTFLLVVNYLLVEHFRYPYYALHSLKLNIRAVTWLRYNVWIVLYPLGFVLEAVIFTASIPYYYRNRNYALEMPNPVNFSFNFGVFLAIFMATIFPYLAYTLFMHMYRQRAARRVDSAKKQR